MRLFFSRRLPAFDRMLVVESGSRSLVEGLLPGLYELFGERLSIDLVTCYAGEPEGFRQETGRVYRVWEYPDRAKLFAELARRKYSIVGIICSAEPIMTKWKWAIAARVPAKVYVLNENGDYFWVDWGNTRTILHFMLFRAGLTGANAVTTLGRLMLFPFTLLYLLLFAAVVHISKKGTRMKAIVISQHGGAEQLELRDIPVPSPGPGQVLVKVAYAGVNFIDVYFRIGLYKADPPFTPGMEASGVVEAIGEGVSMVSVGDRVAYAMSRGSYAEYALVPEGVLVKMPAGTGMDVAAAAMLQGMTAHYLTHSTFALKTGDTALVHAAAGGAGLVTVQMAKMLGARVFGTTSTEAKAALAREAGCDEVILYTSQDFVAEVKRLTGGRGVDVVYDSVGQSTFMKSLDCLRPRGMMVAFGQSSGAVAPFDPLVLNQKGSLFVTRPSLAHHCLTREELSWRAGDVLGWVASGKLKLHIDRVYPLAEAAQAHRDLEGRKTTGKLLLGV